VADAGCVTAVDGCCGSVVAAAMRDSDGGYLHRRNVLSTGTVQPGVWNFSLDDVTPFRSISNQYLELYVTPRSV